MTTNIYDESAACYVRVDLCFNGGNIFSNSFGNVFFGLLISNLKLLLIGIFYRPPNINTFLENFLSDLKLIDLRKT